MTSQEAAVVVRDVSKRFRLYHEKASSLKERIVNFRSPKYEEFWALKDVSVSVDHGETFGLIGANGSGKSTLLKCVAGIIRPDTGTVTTRGRVASLLELGAGFHPDLTGRENIYLNASILGLSRRETARQFDSIVAFSELDQFIDTQVKHYSSGMYVRLGFAVAVHVEPEILLVDEVLSVGDERFQRKCLDRIKGFQRDGRTIVLVTHAMDLVREICTRAAFVHEGVLRAEGPAPEVIRAFRDALHGEAHLEAAPGEERGNRQVQILRVQLCDGTGSERDVFRPGDDLVVSIDLDSPEPLDDVKVGIALFDEVGRLMLGTNTVLAGLELGRVHGKFRTRLVCHGIPMQAGRYEMTVGVTSHDDRTVYHWQERLYAFSCERTGLAEGNLAIPVSAEMEQL